MTFSFLRTSKIKKRASINETILTLTKLIELGAEGKLKDSVLEKIEKLVNELE